MSLIQLKDLSRSYFIGGSEIKALKPINMSVEKGEFLAIFGQSDSGKSTMLNMLGILDKPSSGQYLLEGDNVAGLSDRQMAAVRCRKIGIIFQSFSLFTHLNINFAPIFGLFWYRESRNPQIMDSMVLLP